MNKLVPFDKLKQVDDKGKELYQTNEHFRNIATVMEHPEFRKFYDMYMTDAHSIETILLMMKLYEVVEKKIKGPVTPYQKIAIVNRIITDPKMRKNAVKSILNWRREEQKKEIQN